MDKLWVAMIQYDTQSDTGDTQTASKKTCIYRFLFATCLFLPQSKFQYISVSVYAMLGFTREFRKLLDMNKILENSFKEIIKRKNKKIASGKTISMKDVGRQGHHTFICEAYTYLQQHNNEEKYFFFERLKRIRITGRISNSKSKVKDIEYRISYYIVGKNGTKKDKWTFGQFCPTIPPIDFEKLINKAKKEKIIFK